jgi:RHS repeat-associated protein
MHTVTDARGNAVMTYKYDMLGHLVYQKSMDAGQRWLLTNVVSNPLRTWDERSHEFQYFYDVAHRPTASVVIGGDGATPLNNIFSKIVYGESLLTTGRTNESTLQVDNILGKPIETYDTGGGVTTPSYDFKGQPTAVNRQLFARYKEVADWTPTNIAADLETTVFTFSTQTDALGRITQQTAPDGSVITPSYNEAGLLNAESVLRTVSGTLTTSIYIKNIDYNEKGQRSRIIYGNDVSTNFYYDPLTFRLSNLISKRQNNDPLQDWFYTYDAVGNITHIEDDNIPTTFFNNTKTTGLSEYTYDALYRLIEATGRENDIALSFATENYDDSAFMGLFNSGDAMAIKSYTQQYEYDAVGNMLHMKHQATGNNWTRDYNYNTNNNRLTSTQVGSSTFSYNYHAQHGFIKSMSHLTVLDWNFKEEIAATSKQSVSSGTPETTYYQYDGSGQRIRKITENASTSGTPTLKNERIYIAGYERFENYLTTDVTETLSLLDEGHRFVMIEKSSVSGTLTRYQLHNHLGSSSLELDDSANIISYEEYHPFGTTSYQAKSATITATAKRYRYTGMERDEETGLNYHGARYYITWLGRWMNTDPIGIGDGVNVYRYCKNNPVMKHDPSGMAGEPPKEAEKRTIEHTTRMDGGDGKAIETKTAEVQFWHNEDANGKGGWYSGQEYGKMLEKVTLGMADNAHLLNELNGKTLAMGFSHRKDARTYLDEAKQAAQDFYAKNGNNLSEDNFLSITSNNIGAVAEDWNNHNTGSGKVESPAIDPIDFIGPGLIKVGAGILKTLAKTAVTVASKEAVKLLLVASLRSEIQGTVSSLTKVAQAEVRTLSSLPNAAKTSSNLWKVGAYNELQGVEAGLQAHHVGQKSLMGKLVPGYNPANAPSILVPEIGHVTNMPSIGRVAATRGLGGFTNARQVIVRDIFELRRVYGSQGIPNSSLQELIQMNKTMYPGAFIK